jgi:hypothetical protein
MASESLDATQSQLSAHQSRGLLAFRDLKEAVTLDTNVPTRVGVKRGASGGHQNPILGPYVRRQASARRRRQAQGRVRLAAIYVVGNFNVCIHAATVSAPSQRATDFRA